MKIKKLLLPVLAGGSLVLPSWGDQLNGTQLIKADAADKVAESALVKMDYGVLAKKTGFAAHLPADTEGFFSIIGGYDMYQRLLKTEVGKLIAEIAKANGEDLAELEKDDDVAVFKSIVGEEVFAAFGDTAGSQYVHLNDISKSVNFLQMKMLVQMMALELKGEGGNQAQQGLLMSMVAGMLNDPKAGISSIEKSSMPPVLVGFKISDADRRSMIADTIAGGLGEMLNAGPEAPFVAINEKRSGVQLTGVTIDGKQAAALADEQTRQQMSEFLGSRATVDRLMKAVSQKNLHIASGVKDDYILIYLGGSLDGFKLADTPEKSLLSAKGMDFLARYASKDLRLLLYGENEAFDKMMTDAEGFASMALGLKEGLAETEVFGDTRDVQTLLGHVAKLDRQLFGMIDYDRMGMVGFIEDGFKIEGHGGSNLPSLDTTKDHQFAGLGDMEDVFLFSNTRTNPEFTGKLHDMLDSLGEATYMMAGRVADLEIDDRDFREFKEGFGMFQKLAAKDLGEIWGALATDWAEGTGDEGALIIDFKGTMPKIPEVPGVIIEKGKLPRITYVTPVTDKTKLSKSWTRIEKALTNVLKTVKENGGPEIPMQELIETESNGIKSFFYPIPTTTKNARPIVALTEKNFFLSTSQLAVAEVKAKLEAGNAPARRGAYTRVNFAAAQELVKYWVELAKENKDDIFENDFQKDDFMENLPMIEKFITAFGELKDMTSHTRREGGESRASIHFNMK